MEGGGLYSSDDEATSSDEGLMKKESFSISNNRRHSGRLSETEEEESSELFEINLEIEDENDGSWFSFDFRKSGDCVYVGISDNVDSSTDVLQWTLNHAVLPFTIVYLLHVSPQIRCVPSPLGMLPRSRVSPRLVEKYVAEVRAKRREFLHKLVDTCSAAQIKVEVLMIESDMVAKAIVNVISIFNVRKLILGSTKDRKWMWRSRRGNGGRGIAEQILRNAAEFCDVKIICEGKETTYQMIKSSSSSSSSSSSLLSSSPNILTPNLNGNINLKSMQQKEYRHSEFFSFMCFGF